MIMENSKFQFKGFSIIRSLIERKNNKQSSNVNLSFSPKGYISKQDSMFHLHLGVKIDDEFESFKIEIDSVATYKFEDSASLDSISHFFYLNAPAILFPYIRAYISTLTNLSGFQPINLPTLNMEGLGEDLKANTSILESDSVSK